MEVTEVRVKLVGGPSERVKAFCTITLDGGFVIRDLKVIEGPNGLFLAMPSRKLADRCPKCAAKNHLRARFCNHCGAKLNENRAPRDEQGRVKLHADVAHPINAECRELIQTSVVEAFRVEVERSGEPGYEPAADIDDEFGGVEYDEFMEASRERRTPSVAEPAPARDEPRSRPPVDRPGPVRSHPMSKMPNEQVPAADTPRAPGRVHGKSAPLAPPPPPAPRQTVPTAACDDDDFAAGIV